MSANFRSALVAQIELSDKMRALTDHLEKAVAEENYENAATLARPDQATRTRNRRAEPMKFSNVMSSAGEWLRGEGPHHQIVVSSRVRLARNLRHRAFPGWAKKAERTPDSRADQAAGRRAAGDAGFLFGVAAGSFRARKTGAGRAPSHQPRARRQGRRQRGGHEPQADAQHHDQRGGSPAHAGDPLRPAAQERFQAGRQSRQRARGKARLRLSTRSSAISPPARPMSAPACAPPPCCICPGWS